ncbi:ABC transporter substrate-binding protein, partial [Paenibacillus sepulcri]|nr:ABC transporter substrate-binding protein [Paenibacillus sepulcri]
MISSSLFTLFAARRIKRSLMNMTGSRLVFAGLVSLLLMSGCSDSSTAQKPADVLKVAGVDETTFEFYYQDYFDLVYPDLPVELVAMGDIYQDKDPIKAYKQLIEKEKPDIIILPSAYYSPLADQGLLEDLTGWMSRSDMAETDYQPGAIAMLKDNEENKIYGLAPSYDSSLLYYNADLFKQYGIDPPTSGMTWKELLQLSYRFKQAGGGIVGYHDPWMQDLNALIFDTLNGTEGLQLVDWQRGIHLLDTPAWHDLLQTAVEAVRNGSIAIKGVEVRVEDGGSWIDEGAIEKQ